MKIHASSFGLDMNALLNQLNSHTNLANADAIYQKAMKAVQPKLQQATATIKSATSNFQNLTTATQSQNIKYVDDNNDKIRAEIQKAHDDLTDFYNNKHFETTNQLNSDYDKLWGHLQIQGQTIDNANQMISAVKQQDQQLSSGIAEKIKASNEFTQQVLNNDMPQEVQNQMQQIRDTFPSNQMMYYPTGQFPATASVGDICWQSGNFNGQDINAKAYRYNGSQWVPVKTQMDLFASNIFSPNIHGGTITGSQFVSQYHGIDGKSNFYVNEKGDIYARNFSMDLKHHNAGSEVNNITYDTEGQQTGGLNFNDGLMHMTAYASQNTGTLIKDYQGQYVAATYLEPDYLKLRGTTPSGQLIGRTDLRGGNLEISDQYNQNWGVRIGYWNDSSGNEGPKIAIENGVQLGYINGSPNLELGDWNVQGTNNDRFKISNEYNSGSVEIDAPTNINGTFLVDNDTIVKGKHYSDDMQRINNSFDRHQQALDQHARDIASTNSKLDNMDQQFANQADQFVTEDRTIDANSDKLAYHEGWLHKHDNHLDTHDEKIAYHEGWLHQHDNQFGSDETQLAYDEGWLHHHDSHLKTHDQKLAYHEGWLHKHDGKFSQDEGTLAYDAGWLHKHDVHLTTHDQKLAYHEGWLHQHDGKFSTDEGKLAYHDGWLHKHDDHLKTHDEKLAYHEGWLHKHDDRFGGDETALGQASSRIDGHDKRLDGHDARLDRHKKRLDQYDTDIQDLNTAISRLDIADGTGGDVSFKDLATGHFTFHNSISILNDNHANNSLSIGGYNGSSSTQLWDSSIYTETLNTTTVNTSSLTFALSSSMNFDPNASGLSPMSSPVTLSPSSDGKNMQLNGTTLATQDWANDTFATKAQVATVPPDVATTEEIPDVSNFPSKAWVRGCIQKHVKEGSLKDF